ncbi:MAG: amidohydrolase family protein [Clostridia bacterium]
MIIDVHIHYGYLFLPIRAAKAPELIASMDNYGIDLGIVSHLGGIFGDFRQCNRELKEAISPYSDRLKGYIVVNPNYPAEALAQLEEFAREPSFVGVKLHASWHDQPIDGPAYRTIFDKCEELSLPVLVHSYVIGEDDQVSSPERIARVAKRHAIPLIMAHMGGNATRGCRAVMEAENLYMDISSGRERASQLYVWELGRVENAVRQLGADKVLFGSDLPLLDPAICMGMMADSNLTATERRMVMGDNAARIFGFGKD